MTPEAELAACRAALRRWALQREDQRIAGGQVAAFVANVKKRKGGTP